MLRDSALVSVPAEAESLCRGKVRFRFHVRGPSCALSISGPLLERFSQKTITVTITLKKL